MLRHVTRAAGAIVFLLVGIPTPASGYAVAVRWTGRDASNAGYRLYVRPAGGAERAPIDVPRPSQDGSGRFETVVDGLDVETTYTFAISAYREDGSESDRSNSHTIGYAQAATIVDSDHDGLTDAEEDRNLNLRLDAGESDRLVADSDGDDVPDGIERDFGSDPLDGNSPSCAPLDFTAFRIVGNGAADVGFDAELGDLALVTTPIGLRSTAIGVIYPQYGAGSLTDPLIVTRVRASKQFRIDVHARSTDGRLYRLRYDGFGRVNRVTRRRLRRSLGSHFTADRYELIGIDVAAEIGRMDPGAVFDRVERLKVHGSLLMQRPRTCE